MRVVETIEEFRAFLAVARDGGHGVGLVPTMGYLHDGHLSLMHRARTECDVVAVTVFVNPLQFAEGEDLADYPRDLDRDTALCGGAGVDIVLAPSVAEMYPEPTLTTVHVAGLGETMEGAARPGHFDGVSTVVAKLFSIAGPCRAYFGEKDYQQLAIVTRMAKDLDMPVEVVGCPIMREVDGLAMSSRNVYLTAGEREAALVLHRSLQQGVASILAGERDSASVATLMAEIIGAEPAAELDYASVVDASTLTAPGPLEPGTHLRLLVAAKVGRPRLLDNTGVTVPG